MHLKENNNYIMVEIFKKAVEHKSGLEWMRVTRDGDTEKVESLHDYTGKLTEREVIAKLNSDSSR
mgnify:CR=1 FL=1|jgi:hypothetical protein